MSETYTAEALLTIVRTGLIDIGYHRDLLHDGYTFADVFAPNQPLRYVDLAAFAQEPPTYRNVCFGIAVPYHDHPEAIMNYRALGAPQILALHPQEGRILLWQMLAQGMPKFIEAIEPAHLSNAIQAHRVDWNPERVFRAKSIRFTSGPTQLDFFDAGLVPTLEDKVHEKLSQLLEDVIASCEAVYKEHHNDELDYRKLFRLIFRLVAAKLLADRGQPGDWGSSNVQMVLKEIENFYFQHTSPGTILNDPYVQGAAWKHLLDTFSFQNLSVEALAYVYENTLVSPEKRKRHGIHATPPSVAEYLVQNLPINELARDERRVFEPFCGHAPFLTAVVKRLRTFLKDMDVEQRHDYLVRTVAGMELDSFACEVALNCLIETDYPNPNGWRIENTDAFSSSLFTTYLEQANIVFCNPPYQAFSSEERKFNPTLQSANKAVEALRRILLQPPKMLGFVLPRSFIDGQMYRQVRKQIAELYDQVSLLVLPDNAFHYSDVETVLLSAYGIRTAHPVWRSALVKKIDYQQFVYTGESTWQAQASATFVEEQSKLTSPILWYTPMQPVWDALAELPRLGNIAEVHRGIEYNIPFEENKAKLVSDVPLDGFVRGLARITDDFEPFAIKGFKYLNVSPEKQLYEAYLLPWNFPKVIVNAVRKSVGPWTILAALDEQGLVCYQNFHGIWPTSNVPLEVITAVLNGPLANAFLSTHNTTKHNKLATIQQIPIPLFNPAQTHRIVSLVREYMTHREQWDKQPEQAEYFKGRCRGIMKRLDGEILMAYNLPLQLEQKLIQYFDGAQRPGPLTLTEIKPSPTKRLYNSIIKIVDIRDEDDKKVLEVALMNWNPHQTVDLPVSLIPQELRAALDRDVLLLAKVNIGASEANELFFEDFRLPPEVETTW